MIKEKYEVREHVVRDNVLVEQKMFCDVCKKEIKHLQYYWEVNIGHVSYDGYDSERFDVCSEGCLKEKFNDYCEDSSYDRNYEIDVECHLWRSKGEAQWKK